MPLLRTRRARLLLALPIAGLALSLAACGPSRPSVDEVADGLHEIFTEQEFAEDQKHLYTEAASACIAKHLVESDLTDATLAAIADGRDEPQGIVDRDLTVSIIKTHSPECLGS